MQKIHSSELLLDTRSMLGEGPVWDVRKQVLFWVDIEGGVLHCLDPSTGKQKQWSVGEMVGAAIPTEQGHMLLALETGLATFHFDTETLDKHGVLRDFDPKMRYNDGKVGPNGDFWIGSMHKETEPEAGSLYRVDRHFQVEEKIGKTSISNGMAWTSDNKSFYYSDTATYEVWRFDYDISTGEISGCEVAFTIPEGYGGADGMCIDAED
ncbi:MAG: SMP-30/gluconolactonase/LRE family protein, partial [Pricia sp.]